MFDIPRKIPKDVYLSHLFPSFPYKLHILVLIPGFIYNWIRALDCMCVE